MIVVGGWPGRNVVGLNGRFGVRPAAFAAAGDFDNPFLNDVDGGDTTTEFVGVVSALPASGTATFNDDGGFSHIGAADGTYTTTFTLYTWAQGGPVTQHSPAEVITTTFGASTVTATLTGSQTTAGTGTVSASLSGGSVTAALSGAQTTATAGSVGAAVSGTLTAALTGSQTAVAAGNVAAVLGGGTLTVTLAGAATNVYTGTVAAFARESLVAAPSRTAYVLTDRIQVI